MEKKEDLLFFVFMASFWSLNYPLVKISLSYENAFSLLLYRVLFSLLGILLLFNRRIKFRLPARSHAKMIILSLFNVVIFMELWFIGESTVSSSLSSIIIYTYPIISTLLSLLLLKEKFSSETILGLILGFSGVIVIFSNSLSASSYYGIIFEMFAALSWSLGTVFYKRYIKIEDRITTNFYQFVYSVIPVTAIAFIFGNPGKILNPPPLFLLLAAVIGIPGTAVAYYFFLRLSRDYDVSVISSLLFIVPAISVIFAFLILGEVLSYVQVAGFILVSIGIVFSSRKNRRQ